MKKLFRRLLAWLHSLRRRDKIMYIGGSDTLPPPLPREEETEVIARLEQGDPQARQTLIERNLRLVVYIARRFENTGINIEDLISIGTIGLIKAINTFRADKNIKLATYASRCIENEILMFLRKNSSQRTEVSFDEPLNTPTGTARSCCSATYWGRRGTWCCGPLRQMQTASCSATP